MNTQIYLLLIRKNANLPLKLITVGAFVKAILKGGGHGIIGGDSLSLRFIKWINVTGFKNSVGFDSGTIRRVTGPGELEEADYGSKSGKCGAAGSGKTTKGDDARYLSETENAFQDRQEGEKIFAKFWGSKPRQPERDSAAFGAGEKQVGGGRYDTSATISMGGSTGTVKTGVRTGWRGKFDNTFLQLSLPDHNGLEFTKHTDNATPQIAYACSSQENLPIALFCFRRKIGLGVSGIRAPFMIVLAQKCLSNILTSL